MAERREGAIEARKAALRARMRARRAELTPARRARAGAAIAAQLAEAPELSRAGRVALFAALADEPDTRPLFDWLRARGHETVFPRCAAGRRLELFHVEAWEELGRGRYGVLEPVAGRSRVAVPELDLVLVPGVAFDAAGRRLGRGAGYYDRTFATAARGAPPLFGVAFAFQLVEAVPAGDLDRRVDAVVTDEALVRVAD